ncbi:MAG TPA: DNA recombination protein RmuC [Phycisphaerales bacterium]|nr:DNA recombination protein RmuC [Phycisphaerales bacterium]
MTPLEVALGVVALVAVAGCVWLLWRAGQGASEAAVLRANLERESADAAAGRDALAAREREVEELRARVNAMTGTLIALEKDLAATREARDAEIMRMEQVGTAREKALMEQHALFQREVERRDRERAEQLAEQFKALSASALDASSKQFLQLAQQTLATQTQKGVGELEQRRASFEQLLAPIRETLQATDAKLNAMDKSVAERNANIEKQLQQVAQAGDVLRSETSKLVRALSKPEVRGRYGEIQLKKVAELAGMTEYCDFSLQENNTDDDGTQKRPDMVVKMPSGRCVVVDAKANIQAYLDAQEATTDVDRDAQLERFARHVAEQVTSLAKKKYWSQFDGSPEFVVMFLPHDAFLDAALTRRPDLMEKAWADNVILATPSTLIAMLRAVYVGYQEQKLAKEAVALKGLGQELLQRAAVAFGHMSDLGQSLNQAVDRFNKCAASFDARLLPTLRKFEEAGTKSARELEEVGGIDRRAAVPARVEVKRLEGSGAETGEKTGLFGERGSGI